MVEEGSFLILLSECCCSGDLLVYVGDLVKLTDSEWAGDADAISLGCDDVVRGDTRPFYSIVSYVRVTDERSYML